MSFSLFAPRPILNTDRKPRFTKLKIEQNAMSPCWLLLQDIHLNHQAMWGPQTIAKLVHITWITMLYDIMIPITLVHGVYEPGNITGGAHCTKHFHRAWTRTMYSKMWKIRFVAACLRADPMCNVMHQVVCYIASGCLTELRTVTHRNWL